MWTKEDIIIALFMMCVVFAILVLIVRAMYPNRVVVDERDEFDEYVAENPETRFRKASGEEV